MMNFFKRPKNLAMLSLLVVFMALIRIVAQCIWICVSNSPVAIDGKMLEPFLYAALITAIICFALSLLVLYQKYRPVIILAVINIALLVAIKIVYNL